jgi:hypothetical protein
MTDWGSAHCIGKTKVFFSDRSSKIQEAKKICEYCPIKFDCLRWALVHQEAWGVWGGLSYQELRIVAVTQGYKPPSRSQSHEVEHGTDKGWAWHRRQKMKDSTHEACQPCIDAYNASTRIRVARYRKKIRKIT